MTIYKCEGFRPIRGGSIETAAYTFAGRLARREYGKRGYARMLRLDSWNERQTRFDYAVFIGRDVAPHETRGRNESLSVYVES